MVNPDLQIDRWSWLKRPVYLLVAWGWLGLRGVGILRSDRERLRVLVYHGVRDDQAEAFRKQIRWLASKGLLSRVEITFDDGFENVVRNALPVLEALDVQPTIAIVTDQLGEEPGWLAGTNHPDEGERLCDSGTLKSLVDRGAIRLASHGHTHRRLTGLSWPELCDELQASKAWLQAFLGEDINRICLPHGAVNAQVLRGCSQVGFRRVDLLTIPWEGETPVDLEVGHRYSASPVQSALEFQCMVRGGYDWLVRARGIWARIRSQLNVFRRKDGENHSDDLERTGWVAEADLKQP